MNFLLQSTLAQDIAHPKYISLQILVNLKGMQNKYFGDIGDFGKYSLLRRAQEKAAKLSIGINWYLNEDKNTNKDGKHIAYLKEENFKFKFIDEDLYESLKKIIVKDKKERNIKHVKKAKILKLPFSEFNEPVPIKNEREEWFAKSLDIFKREKCKLLFLDPDNQVEIPSNPNSKKHVRHDEILKYWEKDFSLIIYNHMHRINKIEYQKKLRTVFSQLELKGDPSVTILEYGHIVVRYYVFLIQKKHQREMEPILKRESKLFEKDFFKLVQ